METELRDWEILICEALDGPCAARRMSRAGPSQAMSAVIEVVLGNRGPMTLGGLHNFMREMFELMPADTHKITRRYLGVAGLAAECSDWVSHALATAVYLALECHRVGCWRAPGGPVLYYRLDGPIPVQEIEDFHALAEDHPNYLGTVPSPTSSESTK